MHFEFTFDCHICHDLESFSSAVERPKSHHLLVATPDFTAYSVNIQSIIPKHRPTNPRQHECPPLVYHLQSFQCSLLPYSWVTPKETIVERSGYCQWRASLGQQTRRHYLPSFQLFRKYRSTYLFMGT